MIFAKLLDLDLRFIVRLKGDRHLLSGKKGKIQVFELDYGSRKVRLPSYPDAELNLVVVKGKRCDVKAMFLTNFECGSRKTLNKVVRSYFARWAVEEMIRFRKQEFDLEDIRLRSWTRLQNMTVLVLVASGFAAMKSSLSLSGAIMLKILELSKRAGRLKKFILYAVRYGMGILLNLCRLKFDCRQNAGSNQLSLFETVNTIGTF